MAATGRVVMRAWRRRRAYQASSNADGASLACRGGVPVSVAVRRSWAHGDGPTSAVSSAVGRFLRLLPGMQSGVTYIAGSTREIPSCGGCGRRHAAPTLDRMEPGRRWRPDWRDAALALGSAVFLVVSAPHGRAGANGLDAFGTCCSWPPRWSSLCAAVRRWRCRQWCWCRARLPAALLSRGCAGPGAGRGVHRGRAGRRALTVAVTGSAVVVGMLTASPAAGETMRDVMERRFLSGGSLPRASPPRCPGSGRRRSGRLTSGRPRPSARGRTARRRAGDERLRIAREFRLAHPRHIGDQGAGRRGHSPGPQAGRAGARGAPCHPGGEPRRHPRAARHPRRAADRRNGRCWRRLAGSGLDRLDSWSSEPGLQACPPPSVSAATSGRCRRRSIGPRTGSSRRRSPTSAVTPGGRPRCRSDSTPPRRSGGADRRRRAGHPRRSTGSRDGARRHAGTGHDPRRALARRTAARGGFQRASRAPGQR